jgi:dTDP-4-dehydrorhamnose 3,5-epimerase
VDADVSHADISGVVITPLREIRDARGAVLHMLRADAPEFEGFGECYFSEVSPGAVKAWKRHTLQVQNLAVPMGCARIVIYDDRESSPTRGALQVLEVGRPHNYVRVRIPPGVWYGFACVGSTPALLANCATSPHDPAESETRDRDDPAVPYAWPHSDRPSPAR